MSRVTRIGFTTLRNIAAIVRVYGCNIVRKMRAGGIEIALNIAMMFALVACASQNARFYTEVPQAGHLTAGSPVVNLGSPVGSVASVSRLADGNAGVAFDIDRSDADAIRRASIMVVRDDPGGASLDVMNADPLSPSASPGTQIDGAANQSDANALVAAKNLAASAPATAMMMSAPGGGTVVANASPAALALQQQILALQGQLLIAGTSGTAIAAQQLQQINQNAAVLERQLVAAGNTPEAERLRRQIEALSNTLTNPPSAMTPSYSAPPVSGATPPVGTPPSTLVIPPTR
jgi:hypothetical protein